MRSKRSSTSRMKPDRTKELFRIRAARKVGPEQFGAREVRREQKCGKSGKGGSGPIFARPEYEKALSHGPISFGSYGNAWYAG